MAEFDAAVAVLRAHSVPVTVFPDTVYHVRCSIGRVPWLGFFKYQYCVMWV